MENRTDFLALAEAIDSMREVLRACVAGLVEDGYTEEQARILVVAMFQPRKEEPGDAG